MHPKKARTLADYFYYSAGLCVFCGEAQPLAPWGDEPGCFECRGYTVLDCEKHIIETVVATDGGRLLPVTTCGACSDSESA